MRILRLLAIAALALLLCPALPALAIAIPAYTPNVVDPAGVLSDAQRQRVNAALQQLRDEQNIWGAVYLVPSLEGEDIERVADTAFQRWQLGNRDVNNGLLLVLSMQDRRSRFEVGYGLEGVLPDVVAKRALDEHLAPKMRQGDTAGAIVDAFGFMARVAAKDPDSLAELSRPPSASGQGTQSDWTRGAGAWAGLLALIWLPPLLQRRQRQLRARLLQRHPELADAPEEIATSSKRASSGLFIKLFLSVNPGVFVLVLSSLFVLAFWLWIGAELLALGLMLALSGRRYRSPQRYRSFLKQQERTRKALIRKGHVVETGTGAFAYTAAYYASEASSSGSSSSSSSNSSSSGGGSSGGGGASSSW